MAWKERVLLFTLLWLAKVQGQAPPLISTRSGQTWTSSVGAVASMSCQVENLGTHKLDWVFVKDSTLLFHGDQRMVQDDRFMLMHTPDGNVYSLQIMFAREEDQGVYKCEVDGTTQAVTMQLVLNGAPAIPAINTTARLNRTVCCQQQGVSEDCVPVCYPPSTGAAAMISACDSYITEFIYCGSDGRNHEDCCARSNVPAGCLMFCSNDQQKMPYIGSAEQYCLFHVDAIISCFQYGGDLLPSPPESLSLISVSRNGTYSIQVSWQPPKYNPSTVNGYRVYYKKLSEDRFMATKVLNAATNTYSLTAEVNKKYTVYVIATAQHGSSQPSNRIDIVVQDTSSPDQVTDVLACCQKRNVSPKCQMTLCHPRVWAHFSVIDMIECYVFLTDVVTCLNGEVDHTGCCRGNNVPEKCVRMCNGQPPPFNNSLAGCIPKLSVIEACIQTGLSDQPLPPQGLTLTEVGSHHVVVTWTGANDTTSAPVRSYYVQLLRGSKGTMWETKEEVVGTFVMLTNLTETENYAVRLIAKTDNSSSLPSAVLWFTTYPETSPDERPTVAHNISKCCVDHGMPAVCSAGCKYQANMTTYFESVLFECMDYIGTVLTCAADGRDHTPCCRRRGVNESCYDLCAHDSPGPLDWSYLVCIPDTAKIVQCYKEGLEDLVRMPEDVEVTNMTSRTITLQWKNPETGPRPQSYQVTYVNLHSDTKANKTTRGLRYILQNLVPGTGYSITVSSLLNDTSSPSSYPITTFTPLHETDLPFTPQPPTNTSRVLWTNRTHCCNSSGISPACQAVCMNRPATDAIDCTTENHNILVCAADGQDHSLCCLENGLPEECLPLCGSHAATDFSVELAGCLADARLSIITSCFLDNSGLLPSIPFQFRAQVTQGLKVVLTWTRASNCDEDFDPCSYDVHYWPADNTDPSRYTTLLNVSSPSVVSDLKPGRRYTFTVTARNSKGSGAPAPWITLYVSRAPPDISIAQVPKTQVFEQGTTVFLTCDAFNLQGAPRFTWKLRNRTLPSRGRVLRLVNVNKRSEGNYSCTVTAGSVNASAQSYVNVRFKPEFNYFRTDTVRPYIGAEAVLACWFRGHPNTNDASAVWTKDGKPIARTSRISPTVKSRYHTGITAFKLKIADVVPSDYGMYQCNVSNQYGYVTAHTKLIDPAKIQPPVTPTEPQLRNVSGCCRARDVIDTCLPLCSMEVSAEEAIQNPDKYGICLLFFSEMIECAADGSDHTLCCEDKVVPELCLSFCKGQVPPVTSLYNSPSLLQCVSETPTILDCMDRGFDKIPTAPRNLVASFVDSKIKVSWEPPTRNADRVTSYTIYYNFTGNPTYLTETVTNFVGFQHVLNNVDSDHIYHIWMTAETYKFGRSQISNIVSISSAGELPFPPTNVRVVINKGTTVVISWVPPSTGAVRAEAYGVYYKPRNAIKPMKELTMHTQITLKRLKPHTQYEAYVASRSRAGEGRKSSPVFFNTGDDSETGAQRGEDSLSGGQIAGIVLAVVVVIAVLILLAVLLYRSRVGKKRQMESVSFQNPSYGNQQVHIGGLPSNNPYDNVMEPQTQPEKDGNFTYARLQEDTAPVEATAQPATDSSTAYATPADPSGVNVDIDSNGAAKVDVSDTDLKTESTT